MIQKDDRAPPRALQLHCNWGQEGKKGPRGDAGLTQACVVSPAALAGTGWAVCGHHQRAVLSFITSLSLPPQHMQWVLTYVIANLPNPVSDQLILIASIISWGSKLLECLTCCVKYFNCFKPISCQLEWVPPGSTLQGFGESPVHLICSVHGRCKPETLILNVSGELGSAGRHLHFSAYRGPLNLFLDTSPSAVVGKIGIKPCHHTHKAAMKTLR